MRKTVQMQKEKTIIKPLSWKLIRQVDENSFLEGRELIKRGWAQPAMDIYETTEEVVLRLDMPGVNEEDIETIFDGNTLRIRAEKKILATEHEKARGILERTAKGYFRIAWLPKKVATDEAVKTFANGVLQINIPKLTHLAKMYKQEMIKGEL